jgi:uncharacterized protein (DUF1330 family)
MYTSFTKETWQEFKASNRAGPVHMLNLIRLRDSATYPDGRVATGREAYEAYGSLSTPLFSSLGARIIWRGGFELTMVGPPEEKWDVCFIAEYPSAAAFVEMMTDGVYREAMIHRQAGVLDSRLIRLAPQATGTGFAG